MTVLTIASTALSSAIFAGFASPDFLAPFKAVVGNFNVNLNKVGNAIKNKFNDAVTYIKKGWNFFWQWADDEPVGAIAGAGAVLLGGGLILLSGGAIIGAIGSAGAALVAGASAVGGLIGGAFGVIRALSAIGWLSRGIAIIATAVTVGMLIRWCVRGVQFLWNFNWNTTDSQIKANQQSLINSLYGQLGASFGLGLGSLLCGALPMAVGLRTKIIKVNPMVLAYIKEISEFDPRGDEYGQLWEETMEQLQALANLGKSVASQVAFMESYKNLRKWIKSGAKAAKLEKIFPGLAKIIAKWGEEGSQSWSFASAIEDAIESIKDDNLRNFTEEFYESFTESCTESMMVVSYLF